MDILLWEGAFYHTGEERAGVGGTESMDFVEV